MQMDLPSAQLASNVRDAVASSLHERKPILHHLNADSSWLLQLPRPPHDTEGTGRSWFNVVLDPWLTGSQSDVASWFSQQWHADPPRVDSVSALEDIARESETLSEATATAVDDRTLIDVIAVSHEFTDHCHKETLLQFSRDIPVIAAPKAVNIIKSWNHFRQVEELILFPKDGRDWSSLRTASLPDWVKIMRIINQDDLLYYHAAVLIMSDEHIPDLTPTTDQRTDVVIYTPHGVHAPIFRAVAEAKPPLETLALMHGLHDISLGKAQQLNLGAHNGLEAQRLLRARYWIGTHDAAKKGRGLVAWFLKRKELTLEEALQKEAEGSANSPNEKNELKSAIDDVRFVHLSNGESTILA